MTHSQQPYLSVIYNFDAWHFVSRVLFFFFFLKYDTLSTVFTFFNALLKTCQMFVVFIYVLFVNNFYIRIEVYIYSKSSHSFVKIWGIQYPPISLRDSITFIKIFDYFLLYYEIKLF